MTQILNKTARWRDPVAVAKANKEAKAQYQKTKDSMTPEAYKSMKAGHKAQFAKGGIASANKVRKELKQNKEKTAGIKDKASKMFSRYKKNMKRPFDKEYREKAVNSIGREIDNLDDSIFDSINSKYDNPEDLIKGLEEGIQGTRISRVINAIQKDIGKSAKAYAGTGLGVGAAGAGAYALSGDKKEKTASIKGKTKNILKSLQRYGNSDYHDKAMKAINNIAKDTKKGLYDLKDKGVSPEGMALLDKQMKRHERVSKAIASDRKNSVKAGAGAAGAVGLAGSLGIHAATEDKEKTAGMNKEAVIGFDLADLWASEDGTKSVALNFPGILNASVGPGYDTEYRPRIGLSLAGPNIGLKFGNKSTKKGKKMKNEKTAGVKEIEQVAKRYGKNMKRPFTDYYERAGNVLVSGDGKKAGKIIDAIENDMRNTAKAYAGTAAGAGAAGAGLYAAIKDKEKTAAIKDIYNLGSRALKNVKNVMSGAQHDKAIRIAKDTANRHVKDTTQFPGVLGNVTKAQKAKNAQKINNRAERINKAYNKDSERAANVIKGTGAGLGAGAILATAPTYGNKEKTAGLLESQYYRAQEDALEAIGLNKEAGLGQIFAKATKGAGDWFNKAKAAAKPTIDKVQQAAKPHVDKFNKSEFGQKANQFGTDAMTTMKANPRKSMAGAGIAGVGLGRFTKDNTNQHRKY